jgi:Arc/MetJ family transcription regulator
MRTNIVLDDELMIQALKSGGFKTKKAAIEQGLKLLVQINSQKKLRELKGKIVWEGDLEAIRRD